MKIGFAPGELDFYQNQFDKEPSLFIIISTVQWSGSVSTHLSDCSYIMWIYPLSGYCTMTNFGYIDGGYMCLFYM